MRPELLSALMTSALGSPWAIQPEVLSAARDAMASGALSRLNLGANLERLIGADLTEPVGISLAKETREGAPEAGWRTFETTGAITADVDEPAEDDDATSPEPEAPEPEDADALAAAGIAPRVALDPGRWRAVARQPGTIAVIPVRGTISNRVTLFDMLFGGGVTPPAWVVAQVTRAVQDDAVKAIILDFDSPGGPVFGVHEAYQALDALRGVKPIVSQVSARCASAAYWMACGTDDISIAPSALAGSIGVYMTHADASKFWSEIGVAHTFIATDPEKVEGNEYEALSEGALAHLREMVGDYMGLFVSAVAKGRGVTPATVRSERFGKGRVYVGDRARSRGLADRVRTLAGTLDALGHGGATGRVRADAPGGRLVAALSRQLDVLEM